MCYLEKVNQHVLKVLHMFHNVIGIMVLGRALLYPLQPPLVICLAEMLLDDSRLSEVVCKVLGNELKAMLVLPLKKKD